MWATVAETLSITKVVVAESDVAAAQITIEILADVTEDSDQYISTKNARLLKNAVAYQAAWLSQHPDAYTSIDVDSATQDGLSYTTNHALAGVLSVHAKMCLDRLSWRRNRSVIIRKPGARNSLPNTLDSNNAVLDDRLTDWRPL